MVVGIVVSSAFAAWLLELPWPAALLLAAMLSPTDPVLASEVQVVSVQDRDAVRLTLSAEGGLNDGTALPAVMLALGLMGLHALGRRRAARLVVARPALAAGRWCARRRAARRGD
ncbi:MAG: cation:proton antiporter [Burkholderiales bacterium]|nr:cation:proton antiporter [Burkholderiales bacterium]